MEKIPSILEVLKNFYINKNYKVFIEEYFNPKANSWNELDLVTTKKHESSQFRAVTPIIVKVIDVIYVPNDDDTTIYQLICVVENTRQKFYCILDSIYY